MHRSTLLLMVLAFIGVFASPAFATATKRDSPAFAAMNKRHGGSGSGSQCNCAVGYKCENNQCRACDGGYTSTGGTATTCTICPVNTFSTPGSACTKCPAGTGQTQQGQNTCNECAKGTFSTLGSGCTSCPSGQISDCAGAKSCSACPAGSVPNNEQSACQLCPGGSFAPTSGLATCTSCSPGYYQVGTGKTGCSICPCGTFNFRTGATTCDPCPTLNGKFTTSPSGSLYQSACHNLDAGTHYDSNNCQASCGSGTISTSPPSDTCTKCSNGLVPNSDQTKCIPKTSPASGRRKRSIPFCPAGHQACPIIGSKNAFECIDVSNDIESCGGCASEGTGQDCTMFDSASSVRCERGTCKYDCPVGFEMTELGCNRTTASRGSRQSGQTVMGSNLMGSSRKGRV